MKKQIELLAPAGSWETFQAVIRAGADAVYLGGSRFGARAYADNFSEEELLAAIDYAHRLGRQVYLTVNTLFKEEELEGLREYLLPYYRQGLDAVIVQDIGALCVIRREFPGISVHSSTQMTITGRYGAEYMKSLGVSRIVTAREMSLAEIREIHENVDIEIESFVHGALCYCYSGQCLLSSMLGGRSGNRGRCAQPCRLPYEVCDSRYRPVSGQEGEYVLSPKDLCTISHIPDLAECGVYSFKIEGRMKKAEYAAGVVSVYRKYIDRYLEQGADSGFAVSGADMQRLLDFGNRSGFTDGYYFRQNGSDMITFQKPGHAKANEALWEEIRETYVCPAEERKEKINGILRLKKDFPAMVELTIGDRRLTHTGDVVCPAKNQPLSREKIEACMRKTGGTPYTFEKLQIELEGDVFLPVQSLNRLRREALDKLMESQCAAWRREPGDATTACDTADGDGTGKAYGVAAKDPALAVSIEDRRQLAAVLSCEAVDAVYLDSICYGREQLIRNLKEDIAAVHAAGRQAFFILPSVFRSRTALFYQDKGLELIESGADGVVVRSYDAAVFAERFLAGSMSVVLDHSLYTWNREAKRQLAGRFHPARDTAPLELNRKELFSRNNSGSEIIIYGRLPLMTSAQCVHANTGKCDRKPSLHYLKDRYGKFFPVKNHCAECYNTIYNTTPLMLFDFLHEFNKMGMAGYRILFTTESPQEIRRILCLYRDGCKDKMGAYTNGHYKRGVE